MWKPLLVLAMLVATATRAQSPAPARPSPSPAAPTVEASPIDQLSAYQKAMLDIERARLANQSDQLVIEREKLNHQREQLAQQQAQFAIEKTKVYLTAGAVLIPLLIGLVTILLQARAQFELKAAELVLSSYSPGAASRRAELLQEMFPHRLPREFARSFDPAKFPGVRLYEMKLELFRALVEDNADKAKVLAVWQELFPEENRWFHQLFPPTKVARPDAEPGAPGDAPKSGAP